MLAVPSNPRSLSFHCPVSRSPPSTAPPKSLYGPYPELSNLASDGAKRWNDDFQAAWEMSVSDLASARRRHEALEEALTRFARRCEELVPALDCVALVPPPYHHPIAVGEDVYYVDGVVLTVATSAARRAVVSHDEAKAFARLEVAAVQCAMDGLTPCYPAGPELSVPLVCTVSLAGVVVFCHAVLPWGDKSVVLHGPAKGGDKWTRARHDTHSNAYLRRVMDSVGIEGNVLEGAKAKSVTYGPFESMVIAADDGRVYAMSLCRMFPMMAHVSGPLASFKAEVQPLTHVYRPELLTRTSLPLRCDSLGPFASLYSPWSMHSAYEHITALMIEGIGAVQHRLMSSNAAHPRDVVAAMHAEGVNLRLLGRVLERIPTTRWQWNAVAVEMAARTFRSIMASLLRSDEDERVERAPVVAHHLPLLVEATPDGDFFWRHEMFPRMRQKYGTTARPPPTHHLSPVLVASTTPQGRSGQVNTLLLERAVELLGLAGESFKPAVKRPHAGPRWVGLAIEGRVEEATADVEQRVEGRNHLVSLHALSQLATLKRWFGGDELETRNRILKQWRTEVSQGHSPEAEVLWGMELVACAGAAAQQREKEIKGYLETAAEMVGRGLNEERWGSPGPLAHRARLPVHLAHAGWGSPANRHEALVAAVAAAKGDSRYGRVLVTLAEYELDLITKLVCRCGNPAVVACAGCHSVTSPVINDDNSSTQHSFSPSPDWEVCSTAHSAGRRHGAARKGRGAGPGGGQRRLRQGSPLQSTAVPTAQGVFPPWIAKGSSLLCAECDAKAHSSSTPNTLALLLLSNHDPIPLEQHATKIYKQAASLSPYATAGVAYLTGDVAALHSTLPRGAVWAVRLAKLLLQKKQPLSAVEELFRAVSEILFMESGPAPPPFTPGLYYPDSLPAVPRDLPRICITLILQAADDLRATDLSTQHQVLVRLANTFGYNGTPPPRPLRPLVPTTLKPLVAFYTDLYIVTQARYPLHPASDVCIVAMRSIVDTGHARRADLDVFGTLLATTIVPGLLDGSPADRAKATSVCAEASALYEDGGVGNWYTVKDKQALKSAADRSKLLQRVREEEKELAELRILLKRLAAHRGLPFDAYAGYLTRRVDEIRCKAESLYLSSTDTGLLRVTAAILQACLGPDEELPPPPQQPQVSAAAHDTVVRWKGRQQLSAYTTVFPRVPDEPDLPYQPPRTSSPASEQAEGSFDTELWTPPELQQCMAVARKFECEAADLVPPLGVAPKGRRALRPLPRRSPSLSSSLASPL